MPASHWLFFLNFRQLLLDFSALPNHQYNSDPRPDGDKAAQSLIMGAVEPSLPPARSLGEDWTRHEEEIVLSGARSCDFLC